MARKTAVPPANQEFILECTHQNCPSCGHLMWNDYDNFRTIRTLSGIVRLTLKVRRCPNRECERYHQVYRPESEGSWALPEHEFGLDLIAYCGTLRYQEHRSVPQIHSAVRERGMAIAQRSVSNLIERYDELLAVSLTDNQRLRKVIGSQRRVILALDGLQPEVGHEVLWVIRDCLSGEILLARTMLSSRGQDLEALLREVKEALPVPIVGVVSDGQHSIRNAVAAALPGVPHGLCHFHYLREATRPLFEADRHAKKELKKLVRGVRPLEREVAEQEEPIAEAIQGYCLAVRSSLTSDGHPPLDTPGLKLHERLTQIHDSLERVEKRGHSPSC